MSIELGHEFEKTRGHLADAIANALNKETLESQSTTCAVVSTRIWMCICFVPASSMVLLAIVAALNTDFVVGSAFGAAAILCSIMISVLFVLQYHASEKGELHGQLLDIMNQYAKSLEVGKILSSNLPKLSKTLTSGHSNVSIVAVYRDEFWQRIPSLLLVEGDVIALTAGDITPGRVYELLSDRDSMSVLQTTWPPSSEPFAPSPRPPVIPTTKCRRGWRKGDCLEAGVKIHIREERRKYAASTEPTGRRSFVLDALSQLPSAAPSRPPIRSRAMSFDTQQRDKQVTYGIRSKSRSFDALLSSATEGPTNPLLTGTAKADIEGSPTYTPKTETRARAAPAATAAGTGTSDRHKHTRAINNQSIELLTLSGDMRCFVMAESPVESFCTGVLRTQRCTQSRVSRDSYVRALFVSVFDDSRTVMWGLLAVSLVASGVRLGLVVEARDLFVPQVTTTRHMHMHIVGVVRIVDK